MSFQGAGHCWDGKLRSSRTGLSIGTSRALDAGVSVLFTVLGSYHAVGLAQPPRRLQLR